jgi:ubiquitin-protein ligase
MSIEKDNIINVSRGQQLVHVMREIKKIQEDPNLNSTTEFIIDESNISKFTMIIRPNDGLYMGLIIYFELEVPNMYPAPGHPINAKCLDNIYHPNIFSGGRLCLKYDGVGNLESGFKETLENLVIAINYLFVHPENYGYGNDMPKNMQETIKKNVEQYRMRVKVDKIPKKSTDCLYKIKEIYDEKINPTLVKIKDWESYVPNICLTEIKKSRYYMFTLGGRKLMDLAKLEDVISQVIRDPRFRFDTAPNIAFVNDEKTQQEIIAPQTPFSVVLAKFKRIIYPDDIVWDPINECFVSNTSFDKFFINCIKGMYRESREMIILCNVVIRSNYKFNFACQKKNNPNYPVLRSEEKIIQDTKNGIRKEYVMTIDQYICNMLSLDNHLIIDFNESNKLNNSSDDTESYINPSNPLWFYISFSTMIIGEDLIKMFTNVAYKFNPTDKMSSYVTLTFNKGCGSGVRLLTDDEIKLVSEGVDESTKLNNDDYYDIELASKYLASTAEQTGLDLSRVSYLT